MPNSSYCGSMGLMFPSANLKELAQSQCFIIGFLPHIPFALAALAIWFNAIWYVLQRSQMAGQDLHIQGEGEDVDNEDPHDDDLQQMDESLLVQIPLQVRWILAFVLIGCGFVEIAELVTLMQFQWFQLASPFIQAFGVAHCLLLYAIAGDYQPCLGLLGTTAIVWSMCSAIGGLRVRWLVNNHQVDDPALPFYVAVVYTATSACLSLCDCAVMGNVGCRRGGYSRLPLDDLDSEYTICSTPSPAVAVSLDDRLLLYVHDRVNFLSRVTHSWITGLLVAAQKEPLEMAHLGKLPLRDSAMRNGNAIFKRWQRQPSVQKGQAQNALLHWPLWRQFAPQMLVAWMCVQAADLLGFLGPLALSGIVQFMSDRQNPAFQPPTTASLSNVLANGWVLAALLFLGPVLQSVLLQTYDYLTIRVATNVRSGLTSMVFHKALALNMEHLPADVSVGSIVGHMSVDVPAVALLFQEAILCFTVPVQLGITLYLLYWCIGWAGPASLLGVVVLVPIQLLLGSCTTELEKQVLAENDGRLKLLNEFLQGIRVIKLYAWETTFMERIAAKRGRQLHFLLRYMLCDAAWLCLALSTPVLVTCTGLGLFTLWSTHRLTADVAFTALSLFNILLLPMMLLPNAITSCINAVVSGKRLIAFLLMPTMDRSFLHRDADAVAGDAVQVDGTFRWRLGDNEPATSSPPGPGPTGSDPSLPQSEEFAFTASLRRGTLTMIVGPVAAGKSTFIKSILGDVPCTSGLVRTRGRIAYVAQQATIFNASLRDNVLFGTDMDCARYAAVLRASGLEQDLESLPQRDLTEIGEKGINLSGGQKQRVSIARALYAEADLVLLDDPLSALDAHVGEHVFSEAVLKLLVGQGRTVVMATHQQQYLSAAHHILLVKDRAIKAQGTLDHLTAAGFLQEEMRPPAADVPPEAADATPNGQALHRSLSGASEDSLVVCARDDSLVACTSSGLSSGSGSDLPRRAASGLREGDADPGKLIQAEDREVGAVGLSVYGAYLRACGIRGVAVLVLLQVLSKVTEICAALFLSHWSSDSGGQSAAHPVGYYLGVYVAIAMASMALSGVSNVCMGFIAVRAARALHQGMLDCVARCPLAFFDTTPLGRIINRFSTDFNTVDKQLPDTLNAVAQVAISLAVSLVTLMVISPPLALIVVPVVGLYVLTQNVFRCTARELQRLDNISKSPIFAHLSESLGGLATLRAYGAGARALRRNMELIDRNVVAHMTLVSADRWLALRLDVLGALVVSSTAFACILRARTLSPGLAGLSLTYALSYVQFVSWWIRTVADAEMQMSSVERIAHYAHLEGEAPAPEHATAPPPVPLDPEWPRTGNIAVKNLRCAYRPGLPLVLRSVSVRIAGGERVGVCGRTGSGKSSLLLALFRLLPLNGGSIVIDGVDTRAVPLRELRARMAVIPQDPVLFAGTVRYNLDPAGDVPDARLWEALRVAQLADAVRALDDPVLENGGNFSAGQRQLFCLARTFLKETRILCMDEATASVDPATDHAIQHLIRTAFTRRTVITVAHRIATILDYDKVLVLADGEVQEYDSPRVLLQADSMFKSLVEAACQEAG